MHVTRRLSRRLGLFFRCLQVLATTLPRFPSQALCQSWLRCRCVRSRRSSPSTRPVHVAACSSRVRCSLASCGARSRSAISSVRPTFSRLGDRRLTLLGNRRPFLLEHARERAGRWYVTLSMMIAGLRTDCVRVSSKPPGSARPRCPLRPSRLGPTEHERYTLCLRWVLIPCGFHRHRAAAPSQRRSPFAVCHASARSVLHKRVRSMPPEPW